MEISGLYAFLQGMQALQMRVYSSICLLDQLISSPSQVSPLFIGSCPETIFVLITVHLIQGSQLSIAFMSHLISSCKVFCTPKLAHDVSNSNRTVVLAVKTLGLKSVAVGENCPRTDKDNILLSEREN